MRWKDAHLSLLTTEEIRDLSRISDIVRLQELVFLLPERIGSPLSVNNLSQILQASFNTVRSIKKEKKCYFWDWGILENEGRRFENFLAVQLARSISAWNEDWEAFYCTMFVQRMEKKRIFLW